MVAMNHEYRYGHIVVRVFVIHYRKPEGISKLIFYQLQNLTL